MHTRDKGDAAETVAVEYLQSKGYTILERNYHAGVSEVDVIAKEKTETVFVEVKSVFEDSEIDISETLTTAKISKLRKAIEVWLLKHPQVSPETIRLDFVGVVLKSSGELAHIEHYKSI